MRSLNEVATTIAAEVATVMAGRTLAAFAMRGQQKNTLSLESVAQGVVVVGPVAQQHLGPGRPLGRRPYQEESKMRRQILIAFASIGILGTLGPWSLLRAISEQTKTETQNVNNIEVLRKRLAEISRIEDKDRFLAEYWKFLAEHHIDILLKKGDRYTLGGAVLVLNANGTFDLISKTAPRENVKKIAHVVSNEGNWEAFEESDISNARYVVLSTDDVIFVVNLVRQSVSIVNR